MVSVASSLPDDSLGREDIETWLAGLPAGEEKDARRRLERACFQAAELAGDRREPTGQPVALYGLAVADILARLGLDDDTLAAAILYRLVPLGLLSEAAIKETFGPDAAHMVADMVRIGQLAPGALAARETLKRDHSENLRRLFLDISNDIRVLLMLLAERVHLMRRLGHLPEEVRQRYSRNTRDIFAPIANRLGVWQVKWELEDRSLRFLEADAYMDIARQLDGRRRERFDYIRQVTGLLQEAFAAEGIRAEISGRPKHIYSIWKKMRHKDVDFSHIFDVRALRVLVDTVADCYAALGVVHSLWRHIPGEFDDYIATPKANMYQSIHTVVVGPADQPLEIQIRTHEMHEHAERGVAAHWRYKEQRGKNIQLERRIQWLRQWLESRDDRESDASLAVELEAGLEPELVYVLSPQGKVIELPYGATPVDFAYAVHTSVGNRCRGAKVDGHMVPLTHQLSSGVTVEILTVKEGGPSRDWLSPHSGYVKTTRARNRIRQWFKRQDFEKHLASGKAQLERELQRLHLNRPNLEKLAPRYNLKGADDVLAAIGRGDLSAAQVAGSGTARQAPTEPMNRPVPVRKAQRRKRSRGGPRVVVQGVEDLMTNLGRCCKPVPRDSIVGYITRGHGITVHRTDCSVISHLDAADAARLVEVNWASEQEDTSYSVDVLVVAEDRKGLLRDISSVFSNEEVDVSSSKTHSDRKRHTASMRFTVEIENLRQLERLLDKLLQVPDVVDARRIQ
ncbi:MAG: bifunctional (p)ppGpp synthetase/guanosine-3',5'-bis(diphosphate) 3'-pyrophosphohydrolase [Pseudomonadota bacterium]